LPRFFITKIDILLSLTEEQPQGSLTVRSAF
jgi:hypothetical protein